MAQGSRSGVGSNFLQTCEEGAAPTTQRKGALRWLWGASQAIKKEYDHRSEKEVGNKGSASKPASSVDEHEDVHPVEPTEHENNTLQIVHERCPPSEAGLLQGSSAGPMQT